MTTSSVCDRRDHIICVVADTGYAHMGDKLSNITIAKSALSYERLR